MTKTVKHRLPARIVEILEDALVSARMERASFDGVADTNGMKITLTYGSGYVSEYEDKSLTDFIKERTRLYRGSWIIHPLEEILAWSSTKDDGSIDEYDLVRRAKGPFAHPDTVDDLIKEVEKLRAEVGELKHFKAVVSDAVEKIDQATSELRGDEADHG